MRVWSVIIGWLLSVSSFAQTKMVLQGTVVTMEGRTVPDASVVFQPQSSSQAVHSLSDSAGRFRLEILKETGVLRITAIGYHPYELSIQNTGREEVNLGQLRLQVQSSELSGVTVKTRRPAIRIESDRRIVDVEGVIAYKSSPAFDLLEQIPGVSVNRLSQSVEVAGKTGVVLYIDGKPSLLTGQELIQYLQQLNSNSIARIEVIDKPSAKYEAQGNAGVINIVLKKEAQVNSGTVYIGGGVGRYEKANGGVRISRQLGRLIKINASYDVNKNKNYTDAYYTRLVKDVFIYQDYYLINNDWSHFVKAGVEVPVTKRATFSLEGRGAFHRNAGLLKTETYFSQAGHSVDSVALQRNRYPVIRNHYTVNGTYSLHLDTTGQMLSFTAGFISYYNVQKDSILNLFLNTSTGQPVRPMLYLIGNTPIDLLTSAWQADYEKPLSKNIKLEAGVRYSISKIKSNVVFKSGSAGHLAPDSRFSALLDYRETIQAAYVNANMQRGSRSLAMGMRLEHFKTIAISGKLPHPVERNIFQLFPSINAGWLFKSQHRLHVVLNRRINRPNFQSLNPAINFVSYYSTYQGNPLLQPVISNTASLVYSFKKPVQVQLSYSYIQNPVTYSFYQDDNTKVSEVSQFNFDHQRNIALQASYPASWFKWWSSMFSVNAFYNAYHYQNFSNKQTSFQGLIRNTFSLPRSFTAELGVSYRSPSVYGYLREESFTNVTFGIQKSFQKFNFALSGRDIFKTLKFNNRVRFDNMNIGNFTRFETQVFTFTVTYQFLKGKFQNLKMKPVMQEEESRISG